MQFFLEWSVSYEDKNVLYIKSQGRSIFLSWWHNRHFFCTLLLLNWSKWGAHLEEHASYRAFIHGSLESSSMAGVVHLPGVESLTLCQGIKPRTVERQSTISTTELHPPCYDWFVLVVCTNWELSLSSTPQVQIWWCRWMLARCIGATTVWMKWAARTIRGLAQFCRPVREEYSRLHLTLTLSLAKR